MHQCMRQKHPIGEKNLCFCCLSFTEINFNKQRTLKISFQEPDSIALQYSHWMIKITAKYE